MARQNSWQSSASHRPLINTSSSNESYSPMASPMTSQSGHLLSQTNSTSEFSQYNGGASMRGSVVMEGALTNSERFNLPDNSYAGMDEPEDDDWLHNEDPKEKMGAGSILTFRGLMNLGCLFVIASCCLMLFAGYPIISYFQDQQGPTISRAFEFGSFNGSFQDPPSIGKFSLIDPDTPDEAKKISPQIGGEDWEMVFSDEFETEGRTFWPGDDPFWEAADLHAWATTDLEYYDPRAVTTKNGSLHMTLSKHEQRDLNYTGAEISTWNKFCFTGGRIEASVRLPGRSDVYGLWPAVWTLGNLGRVGYGATLDGLWPYSYDSCDSGTLANQSHNGVPAAALTGSNWGEEISHLPGQRLSRCTCPDDETHPGPKHSDGTWKGRSAPEIDVIEAQVNNERLIGEVSQSGQWAPFNLKYEWDNATNAIIYDSTVTELNSYSGGNLQQSSSALTETNSHTYEWLPNGEKGYNYAVYAFEYQPGNEGYITWYNDDKLAWTYKGAGMKGQAILDISERPVPEEPMYIICNLAISLAFGAINYAGLEDLWPVHMEIDYIRVYQDPARINIGCDPEDFPTASYIARYPEAYMNHNLTTWEQMSNGAPKPKNRLIDTC